MYNRRAGIAIFAYVTCKTNQKRTVKILPPPFRSMGFMTEMEAVPIYQNIGHHCPNYRQLHLHVQTGMMSCRRTRKGGETRRRKNGKTKCRSDKKKNGENWRICGTAGLMRSSGKPNGGYSTKQAVGKSVAQLECRRTSRRNYLCHERDV